jgi:hypothetical protein
LLAGEEALSDHQFATKSAHHLFCRHCGIRCFGRGYIEQIGGHHVSVQLASLDNATPEELIAAPVTYANGQDNSWWIEPAQTRHL